MPSSLSSCHLGGQWQQLCPHFSLYPPPYLQHTSRIWRAKRCRSCWIRTWTHTVVTSSLFRKAQRCLLFRMASSKHSTSTGLSWKSPTQLACQGHQIWCGRAGVPMLSQQPQELMHPARPALPKENIQSNTDVNWFLSTTLQTHYTGQVICEPQVIPCPRWDNSPGKS